MGALLSRMPRPEGLMDSCHSPEASDSGGLDACEFPILAVFLMPMTSITVIIQSGQCSLIVPNLLKSKFTFIVGNDDSLDNEYHVRQEFCVD